MTQELLLTVGDADEDVLGFDEREPQMLEVVASLQPTETGCRVSWARGLAAQALKPVSPQTEQALRLELAARRAALLPYYRRLALFGSAAEGQPALMLHPEAARTRLQLLGVRPEPEVIEQYRLDPRPFPLPFLGG